MQVGDKCFVGFHHFGLYVQKIERETKTMWVLENGSKYYKKNLRMVGGTYSDRLEPWTQEIANTVTISKRKAILSTLLYNLFHMRNKTNLSTIEGFNDAISKAKELKKVIGVSDANS